MRLLLRLLALLPLALATSRQKCLHRPPFSTSDLGLNYCTAQDLYEEQDGQPQERKLGCICALPVATGLRNPVVAAHAGDGSGRMFIAEQIGVIKVLLANSTLLPEPFLDISSSIFISTQVGEERGLLGLVFHPDHTLNGRFYVYYSASEQREGQYIHVSRVSEFVVQANTPNIYRANRSSERIIFSIQQPQLDRNGGQLLFDDHGFLLIFLGDGGEDGQKHAFDRSNLLGSVLRIDVDRKDSGKEYAIPADNPFVGDRDVKPEIYAYGLRNPWRCSIDRGDRETGEGRGRIFCGDVGQEKFEEVDIIEAGGNYGWNAFEGDNCFDKDLCHSPIVANAIPPIHSYDHDLGVSVTGGYVYRGCLFPNFRGLYIFGDYGSGMLFALREDKSTGEWTRTDLCMGNSDTCTGDLVGMDRARFVLSFGEDVDGELYVLTTSGLSTAAEQGVVYLLVDPARLAGQV